MYFRLVWKNIQRKLEKHPAVFEFKDHRADGSYVHEKKDCVFVSLSKTKRKVTQKVTQPSWRFYLFTAVKDYYWNYYFPPWSL